MLDAQGNVEIIRRIAERLESYLSALPQDSWSRPSRCDGWLASQDRRPEIPDKAALLVFLTTSATAGSFRIGFPEDVPWLM